MPAISRVMPRLLTTICCLALTLSAQAQIVTYNFNGAVFNAPSSVNPNVTANNVNATGSSTTISEGSGAGIDTLLIFGINNNGSAAQAVANNTYFQFTVTPNINREMDLTSLTFTAARGGASTPRGWVLRSSINGFSSNIATELIPSVLPTFSPFSVDLSGAAFQNLTTATTFRVYFFSPAGSLNGNFDNLQLNGTVNAIGNALAPEPGTFALTLLGICGIGVSRRLRRRNG